MAIQELNNDYTINLTGSAPRPDVYAYSSSFSTESNGALPSAFISSEADDDVSNQPKIVEHSINPPHAAWDKALVLKGRGDAHGDVDDPPSSQYYYRWVKLAAPLNRESFITNKVRVKFKYLEGSRAVSTLAYNFLPQDSPGTHEHLWLQYKPDGGTWTTVYQAISSDNHNSSFNPITDAPISMREWQEVDVLFEAQKDIELRWISRSVSDITGCTAGDSTCNTGPWGIKDIIVDYNIGASITDLNRFRFMGPPNLRGQTISGFYKTFIGEP